MTNDTIILTWPDHALLTELVESRLPRCDARDRPAFDRLAAELARATLVASQDVPPDVVTMNTRLRVRDLDTEKHYTFTIAWPDDADADLDRISVLAPVGMALLGCRVGQSVEWPVPGGSRRLLVEAVLFQPESGRPTAVV